MPNDPIILDFIGHTDFAAAIRANYNSPGAAKLAAYFNYFRRRNPAGTVVLDAGDILCGAPIINLTRGEPVVDIVNLFGYDALTLGNHEFDYGRDIMRVTLARARFPLLCANIVERATNALLDYVQPYLFIEKQGVKIGVLGVTTAYTPYMVKAASFAPFAVLDPVAVCNQYIPEMKQAGADLIVVLGHLPGTVAADGTTSGELFRVAAEVPGIDILFGGHNPGDVAVMHGRTCISKTGFSALSIGHIQIAFDRQTRQFECRLNEIVPVMRGTLPVEPSAAVAQAVQVAMQPFQAVLDEVLGTAVDELRVARAGEFALGDFFTDCIKEAVGAEIGLMNSTSCFGYMPAGPITAEMIMWVMCFNDHLYRGPMTGAQLSAMLELTYDETHRVLNGDLQVSGLMVVVDSALPIGQRVLSLTLADGTPLEPEAVYWVGTTAYIAGGGNGYRAITELTTWEQTTQMAHPVFIEKMRARRTLSAQTFGRLVERVSAAHPPSQ